MRRSEVWLVEFDPTVGAEIGKRRPAVIVNQDSAGILPLKVVVPITQWQEAFVRLKWMAVLEPTRENGLTKRSAADTFQVNSVSTERFVRQIGILSETEMQGITKALALVMKIE